MAFNSRAENEHFSGSTGRTRLDETVKPEKEVFKSCDSVPPSGDEPTTHNEAILDYRLSQWNEW